MSGLEYRVITEHSGGDGRPPVKITNTFSSLSALFGWAFHMGMAKDIRHFDLVAMDGNKTSLVPRNPNKPSVTYTVEVIG